MDLALVGIGTLQDSAFIERGALDDAALRRLHRQGVVGEICGRFFDRQGQECLTDYRERVIGVELAELRRCPAVVAVTNGTHRRDALLAALTGGLVKALVLDQPAAEGLLEAVGGPVSHVPRAGLRRR